MPTPNWHTTLVKPCETIKQVKYFYRQAVCFFGQTLTAQARTGRTEIPTERRYLGYGRASHHRRGLPNGRLQAADGMRGHLSATFQKERAFTGGQRCASAECKIPPPSARFCCGIRPSGTGFWSKAFRWANQHRIRRSSATDISVREHGGRAGSLNRLASQPRRLTDLLSPEKQPERPART